MNQKIIESEKRLARMRELDKRDRLLHLEEEKKEKEKRDLMSPEELALYIEELEKPMRAHAQAMLDAEADGTAWLA